MAEDTLVFGSIRRADWSNHQIAVAPQTQIAPTSSFSDPTTYSIGLGRQYLMNFHYPPHTALRPIQRQQALHYYQPRMDTTLSDWVCAIHWSQEQ